jgi:steroid delta-isomerase-like uncharacterized protein
VGDDDPRSVVTSFLAALNRHDVDGACACLAPRARVVGATGRELGRDGTRRLLSATITAFPDLEVRVGRWVVDGEIVVTEEVMVGTHRGRFAGLEPTGRPVELPMCHVARVQAGRIAERISYHDTAGILRRLS